MELPPSPNHTNKLRSLHDELEQQLRCLSSLGEDTEHRHFISLIMTKLPKAVIIKLEEMKDPSEAWTVELVRQKLQNHLVARESADLQGTPVFPRENRSTNGGYPPHQSTKKRFGQHENTSYSSTARERPSRYSTAEMLYASDKEKRVKSPLCVFCTQKHWSDECDKFRTIDSRKRRIKGRCFNCLGKNNNFRSCPSVKPCFHCKKVKSHHSCLCPEKFPVEKESAHVAVDEPEQESADESLLASGERALLQTALVDVISPRSYQTVKLRLLFDSGSHRSYISEDAVQKLGLKWTGSETISVNTFGAVKSKSVKTKIVEFSLKLQDGNSTTIVGNVVPTISASIQRQPINLKKYQTALKGLALADKFSNKHENASIDILIGSHYYMDLITFETKAVGDGLHLLSSKFGWILTGRMPKKDSSNVEHSMLILNATNQTLPNLFFWQSPDKSCPINPNTEEFWSLESIGIKDSPSEISDEQAIEKFNKTVKHEEGRYFVKWPWREETSQLPSNYQLSLGRLNTLIRRFNQNPELMKKYANIIEDQLAKGVIEKLEKDNNESVVHYIPHQAILTPQKNTTKVRIVYDASAKTRKEACSLNECLLRRPVILENLCGLLMRFRLHKYGIVADIEKAFLQVGLQEPDRDVVRFLWLKDSSKVTTVNNLQIYRFCRVPFGVISSPFLLGATLVHHLGKSETAIARQISENLYVDNMITGASTRADSKIVHGGKSLFRQASMNLREWTSNCEGFMTKIPETDRCLEDSPKILGMVWKIKNDSLTFPSVNWDMTSSHVTKREVFKKIAKLFDPLGFVSPVTIRGKMFLQSLWSTGLKWDDQLNDEQQEKWNGILTDLGKISEISVPRYIQHDEDLNKCKLSLLCFCDASVKSYACCIYIRYSNVQGEVKSELIFAKSRLTPIKRQTVPRLELLAVLIGVRSLRFVEEHLRMIGCQKILWSDSKCVLHWINSSKLQGIFVRNRLNEIKNHKDVSFQYVCSKENPADIPTRGISVEELKSSKLWWHGPSWISKDPSEWPDIDIVKGIGEGTTECGPKVLFEASLTAEDVEFVQLSPFGIKPSSFSSLSRLLRVTAYCHRLVDKLKKSKSRIQAQQISAAEIDFVRLKWERAVQSSHFEDVLNAVSKGKNHDLISKFDLFLDVDGLLRCRGRLQNAEMPDDARLPKLLPKNAHLTMLIIEEVHKNLHHSGVSQTLAQLRQQYWLPQGRNQVRKVLSGCRVCKKWQGGPYKVPPMPSFPSSRVSKATPFTHTGVDCLGPLHIKNGNDRKKVWACLFTCLTVRAIHLEIISDLSAEEFLLCFRRFIARRGCPTQMYSDNGSNFVAASGVILSWKDVFQNHDVYCYFSSKRVNWKFIPQHAPWMGGFYERLIGVVKSSLRKAIGKLCLTLIQLQTFLSEVEAIVNSRPLTYVGEEFDSTSILTPNSFLTFNSKLSMVPDSAGKEYKEDPDFILQPNPRGFLLLAWKKGQIFLNQFWECWHSQYLTSLRERSEKLLKQPRHLSSALARIGDVVLVKDENLPRGAWKLARIIEMIPSFDGQFRSTKLRLPSGKQTVRPLALLYPLECSSPSLPSQRRDGEDDSSSSQTSSTFSTSTPTRSRLHYPGFSNPTAQNSSGRLSADLSASAEHSSVYSNPHSTPPQQPHRPLPSGSTTSTVPSPNDNTDLNILPLIGSDYARSSTAGVTTSASVDTSTPDSSLIPPLPSGTSKLLNDYEMHRHYEQPSKTCFFSGATPKSHFWCPVQQ